LIEPHHSGSAVTRSTVQKREGNLAAPARVLRRRNADRTQTELDFRLQTQTGRRRN
jgi:hypothetical protein